MLGGHRCLGECPPRAKRRTSTFGASIKIQRPPGGGFATSNLMSVDEPARRLYRGQTRGERLEAGERPVPRKTAASRCLLRHRSGFDVRAVVTGRAFIALESPVGAVDRMFGHPFF